MDPHSFTVEQVVPSGRGHGYSTNSSDASGESVTKTTTFRFASKQETGALLADPNDPYVRALGPFDRQAKMQSAKEPTEDQYLAFIARSGIDFSPADMAQLKADVFALVSRAQELHIFLPFPPVVILAKTSGREEAGAAYCRQGHIIALPPGMVNRRVLFHEMFHILSTSTPALRKTLYSSLKFVKCSNDVPLPPHLHPRRISNPDVLCSDWYLPTKIDGNPVNLLPVMYSSVERYPGWGSFFAYLKFQLMHIEFNEATNQWVPTNTFFEPSESLEYVTLLSGNTEYINHPEEALADNFCLLMLGSPTPDLSIPNLLRKELAKVWY
ncbi:hypothetical protein Pelo_11925 [Pelomyxa schiedti]|nr:hypothetical protein Pelo_11925 [Pelomyxa schiedti]